MPGLNLNVMGGVKASGSGNGFSPTVPSNSSATAKGFGQAFTDTGNPSNVQAFIPNDPFGIAFWGGIVAVGLLVVIRHSLPG